MLNKTLELRIVRASKSDLEALRLTADVYASCVRAFTVRYLEALRGRPSARYRALMRLLLGGSDTYVHNIVDGLTAAGWRSAATSEPALLAREILQTEGLWFDRYQEICQHDDLPVRTFGRSRPEPAPGTITIAPEMYRAAANAAGWYLRSHLFARRLWRDERRTWLEERAAFLAARPDFARALDTWIRPFEERFTRAHGRRGPSPGHGQRWDRWRLWYDWLVEHPDVVSWRSAHTTLTLPTETELAALERRIRHPGPRAQQRLQLLLDKNPELAALEELRRQWVRSFSRFRRPPATTLPGTGRGAPAWVAPRDRAYRHLDPRAGTVELQVLAPDSDGCIVPQWRTYRVQGDRRFSPAVRTRRGLPALETDVPGRSAVSSAYVDRVEDRKAGVSGLTLLHRAGATYLVAVVPTSLPKLRIAFRTNPLAKVPADRLLPADRQPVDSLRVLALHLAVDPAASYVACTLRRDPTTGSWESADLERGKVVPRHSPTFRQMLRDDLEHRAKCAVWGTPPRNQSFDARLTAHRRHSTLQRQRAAAAQVVALAQRHAVDMILLDDLTPWSPSAANDRDKNRLAVLWDHRRFVAWIEHLARDVGIGVGVSTPWKMPTLCSRCGLPGFRFRVRRKNSLREGVRRRGEAKDFGRPELDPAGPEFRCPHCERTENAGVNAARNHVWRLLHGKLAGLQYHARSGTWSLPDGRSRWDPAAAAAAWFERITAPGPPTTAPAATDHQAAQTGGQVPRRATENR